MNAKAAINLTDEQVIQVYRNGDNNALGVIYNRYYKKVYQKCLSYTKNTDDALDLAQDILVKAFQHMYMFKGISKFSTWLFSITHNHCVTFISKTNVLRVEDLDSHYALAESADDNTDLALRQQWEDKEESLINIVLNLSGEDKDLLELKYQRNYSIKDLQQHFNLSASAVKMRLMRARQKVEQLYNQQNSDYIMAIH